ncbi:MAG: quinol:cytochrome C oxidoreductase, partial [Thermoguttaceae bacterium]
RLVAYFAILGGLTWYLRSRSIRQDASGDPRLTLRMERISAPGMIALALVATFASLDLVMSLNPRWSSTMYGVYFFIGSVLAGLAAITLLALWLRANGRLGRAVTVEHYHDLGKLLFAFVFFWGYIAFSQYMLIWYANMPEETQFYMVRQIGPWAWVSIALVAVQLLIPFLGLLSRHAKRNLKVLGFWAVWLLAAHLLDMFWLVMPSAAEPLEPLSLGVVLGLVAGMGGLYLISTARLLACAPLAPVGDPRLDESLAFENS